MAIQQIPCPDWERLGFASQPKTYIANGLVRVFRCFSALPKRSIRVADTGREIEKVGSFLWGNCLFMPRGVSSEEATVNAVSMQYKRQWTGIYLEKQLNAWVWGNEFERVAMFTMVVGTRYWMGPVGMTTRAYAPYRDKTGAMVPTQRHNATPHKGPPDLLQVVVLSDNGDPIRDRVGLEKVLKLRMRWAVTDPIKWQENVRMQ